MRYSIKRMFALVLLGTFTPWCHAGTVVTRDGQTLTGELALVDGQIKLATGDAAGRSFALKDISQVTFAPAASAPASTYGKYRRERRPAEPTRLFVEYFADPNFKDRRLARYEISVLSQWEHQKPPDSAIPSPCAIRYSAQLVPRFSEDYTFVTDVQGQVRLWIDGKLRIDRNNKTGGDHASGVASLKANVPVSFRMEIVPGRYAVYNRITYTSRSQRTEWIPAAAFALGVDSPKAPEVTLALPGEESHFRDPPFIPFDLKALQPAGKIVSIDLMKGSEILDTTQSAPARIDWKRPPSGQYRIKARAIDDKGITGYSESIELSVGDTGERQSLPAPWAQQMLGKKTERIAGSASFDNGVFKISKAGGQVTEEDDAPQFVYQTVSGDFQIIAHLADLTPNDNRVGPLAGLMIRENVTTLDRFVAVVVGPGATSIARRHDYWGRTENTQRIEPAANWLRMVRHGNRLRSYTSQDGKSWSLLGTERMDLPERVFVGMCDMSRDKETPVVATFDHVSIAPGPPELTYAAPGILFRSGTFLSAEVLGFGKDGALAYTRNGKRCYAPSPDVARLIYQSVTAELAQTLPHGSTGALLASGDFIDGDLKEVTYRVTVSNVVLGPRTMNIKAGEVLAICFKDADPPALAYVLTTTDGSIYQSKTVKISKETISLEDPSLGSIELPLKELAQIKIN